MKTLSNISILLCILLLCTPPDAKTQEVSQWLDLGLYGGQFQTVAVNPSDSSILFAGSYLGGGLFKSTDYGTTWKTVPPSGIPRYMKLLLTNTIREHSG
jgi:hypothetical protein